MEENSRDLSRALADKCNSAGLKYPEILDIQGKKKSTRKRDVHLEDFYSKNTERNLNPFHWDFVFNEIMDRGGFDVILTNPPWEKVELEDKEFFREYDDDIDKRKTKKTVMKQKKEKLLKNIEIRKNYFIAEENYLFQRDYFLNIYKYQRGQIIDMNGKEKTPPVKNMDTYRLFTERCFDLLSNQGFLGIILPGGLHKDEGAVGLRKELLFKKIRIDGLIGFYNQMELGKGKIFEGVASRFKFLLLNLQKARPTDIFPCQFHEENLSVLDENRFSKNPKMKQSIKEIKELSPRDYSIIEFKNQIDRRIFKKARQFPQIGKIINNLWNPYIYTAEFNETHHSILFEKTKKSDEHLPLYPGKAIYQYEFDYDISHVNRYVNLKSPKIKGKGFPFKNKCYKNCRLVIRTITGEKNERSLISTIIPKKRFISNSLYGVCITLPLQPATKHLTRSELSKGNTEKRQDGKEKNGNQTNKYMFLLQAFLNSFVVDYSIRKKVSENMNKRFITSLHIPRLTEKNIYFKELVERSAKLTCIGKEFDELADEIGIQRGGVKDQDKRWRIQGEIDAIVAYVYGLNLEEFEHILSSFTIGKNQERLQALKNYALQAFKKDKLLDRVS